MEEVSVIPGDSYIYLAFGLCIRANRPLPELHGIDPCARPEERWPKITVTFAEFEPPKMAWGPGYDFTLQKGRIWFREPAGSVYEATRDRVLVYISQATDEKNLRFYLYARALTALLYLRGVIPFHASTAAIGVSAVAFIGDSGAGKSSIISALLRTGAAALSDDVTVLESSPEGVAACRGTAHVHLSDEAAAETSHTIPPPAQHFGAKGKHYYPTRLADLPSYHLATMYFLEWDERSPAAGAFSPLAPFATLTRLRDNAYYHSLIRELSLEPQFLVLASQMLASTPAFLFRRPRNISSLSAQARAIIAHSVERRRGQI